MQGSLNQYIIRVIVFLLAVLLIVVFVYPVLQTAFLSNIYINLIIILSFLIAMVLAIGGKILFSLPLFFLALSALKIKGLTAFQIWQIWRLLNYLRSIGRYSHFGQNNSTRPSSNLSADEAYKILGLKKGCTKEEIIKVANGLQKKIHPDVNPNSNTERLSQIVNEAKETVLKDFS